MKNNLLRQLLVLFLFAGCSSFLLQGQTDQDFFAQLQEEEQVAIEALVLYPATTRTIILEAVLYPEVLVKLQRIQEKISTTFQDLMNNQSREVQEVIWDLSRYPDLIHQLATLTNANDRTVREALKTYPEAIQEKALQALLNYPRLLADADDLQEAAANAFQQVLTVYPDVVKDQMQALLALPEVLDLLTENISLTLLVGEQYRSDPDWLMAQMDSLNLVVARKNAQELEDWKQELEANPELAEELEVAASAYAETYAYDDSYYDEGDDVYYQTEEPQRVDVHYYYHYPYWLGYPSWYDYPCWRPYPLWYDWGFSSWNSQVLVIVGLPSYHFTYWYFNRAEHHIWWPHLSSHFVNHYYHHPNHHSGVVGGVKVWRDNRRTVISDEWIEGTTRNPSNFKEYGEFEYDLQRYNQRNPGKELTADKYLAHNTRSYKTLRETAPSKSPIGNEQVRPVPTTQRPGNVDAKTNLPTSDRSIPARTAPTRQAEEYHRNTWEQPKKEAPRPSQPPAERVERRPSPVPSAPRTTKQAPARPTKQSPAPVRKPTTTDKPRKSGGGG
ncbi:hypothetical protein [Lewinella cohaerens]|uniref:hypothetical protein n=1 Tax=Lewinella cohaerens TaxID=70995 RepID=UPI0003A52626|nr:hypothetical protein [Lewinella cohaerens]